VEKTSTGLQENVAGLLCYLGVWITGIIFLVLEPKNRFVRFHAIQSIVTFGFLGILNLLFASLPGFWPFNFFKPVLGGVTSVLSLILWIVLMVKAHQHDFYKLPVAGEWADQLSGKS
jgi:uncharacterized membrane protein